MTQYQGKCTDGRHTATEWVQVSADTSTFEVKEKLKEKFANHHSISPSVVRVSDIKKVN